MFSIRCQTTVEQRNNTEPKRGEGQGKIYTWVRNADPAPSTVGIFPYTDKPPKNREQSSEQKPALNKTPKNSLKGINLLMSTLCRWNCMRAQIVAAI